jgi:hypothetical protein
MKINRQNYEAYLLDYIDGNLPEFMVPAILEFLKNNPDIDNEAKYLTDAVIKPGHILFPTKENLKKNASSVSGLSLFEELSVAFLENDISQKDAEKLKGLISTNEKLKKEHELLQKTKLSPDSSVVFPGKITLRKKIPGGLIFRPLYYTAIAASVTILFGLGFLFTNTKSNEKARSLNNFVHNYTTGKKLIENQTPPKKKVIINSGFTKIEEEPEIDRVKNHLNAIGSIPVGAIQIAKSDINTEISGQQAYKTQVSTDSDFKGIKPFLAEKFKEKVLKQDANEKVTAISLVNAFGRFTKKVLNKKLEVEKVTTDDGALLLAIRTESFDLYTKRNVRVKSQSRKK